MRRSAGILALALVAAGAPLVTTAPAGAADPSVGGSFSSAFEEPGPRCKTDAQGRSRCKPAAATSIALPDGTVLYWDALEGMEDVEYNTVGEFGHAAQDDPSRILDLRSSKPRWATPKAATGGKPNGGVGGEYLPVVPHNNERTDNDGDLFCSDQVHLADGRVLNVGGTGYYLEPGVSGVPYGVTELEGLKATRIYDTAKRGWRAAKSRMKYGRWYPSLVTLPNGDVLVASGVTKLIKPMYPDRPQDSGTNVKQLETFRPRTERWKQNAATADRSLPLYPRLHLLPNGKVYYDAAGQAFNPDGQSYDEALWNMAAVYDPKSQSWTDLGLPAFGPALRGFRGSAFSQQLTLKPPYNKAQFLSAGGVYGVTPGTYLGTDTSTLNTVDVANGTTTLTSEATAPLNQPRWYSTGVTLPTGEVVAFSGADRDEVVGPGTGKPITQPELYDPMLRTWRVLNPARKGRTYHNTALLLQDGRVLVGGHAPINTGYAFGTNDGRSAAGLSDAFRDPSFEIFSPPNLFYGTRPVIRSYDMSMRYGRTTTIKTRAAHGIQSVVLVRNPAVTHLVNADQKVIELPVVKRGRDSVTVKTPPSANVAVPGPYWLFVNQRTAKGQAPSVGRQVYLGVDVPRALKKVIARDNARRLRQEEPRGRDRLLTYAPAAERGATGPRRSADGAAPATVPAVVAPLTAITGARLLAARPASRAARRSGPLVLLAGVAGLLVARRRRQLPQQRE